MSSQTCKLIQWCVPLFFSPMWLHDTPPPPPSTPFLHPMYYSYNLLTLPKYKSVKLFLCVDSQGAWSFGIMFKTYPKVWLWLGSAPGVCSSTVSCTTLISLIGSLSPTAEGQIDIQPASVIRQRQLHILKSFNRRREKKKSAVDDFPCNLFRLSFFFLFLPCHNQVEILVIKTQN